MSFDKNILKNLLVKLLDDKLKRLEKRNIEEIKDLKYTKIQYNNLNSLLKKISLKTTEENNQKKIFCNDSLYNKSELLKHNGNKNLLKYKLSPKYIQKNNNINRALTPSKNDIKFWFTTENWTIKKNKKYNYVKSRYMDETNNKNKLNERKLYLTPETHKIKRKKKLINDKINIMTKNLNLDKIEIKPQRNKNSIKREENFKKKKFISNIDLQADEINFVLSELRNEKKSNKYEEEEEIENEETNSKNQSMSTKSNNNSKNLNNYQLHQTQNKQISFIFGHYISSTEGKNISKLIASFLDIKTKYNFYSCSKKLINNLYLELNDNYIQIMKINKISSINAIEEEIHKIKNKYKGQNLDPNKYSFQLSKGSFQALELLDDEIYNNIFKSKELKSPLDNIILIYRIFFQLMNNEEIIELVNDNKFWEEARNFFLENDNNKLGYFIKDNINEFDFTNENIYKLKKLIKGQEERLKPTIYENICETTGLISFIIKDALEYCGIINHEEKNNPGIIISYLEFIQEKLNECKKYIDLLKSYK